MLKLGKVIKEKSFTVTDLFDASTWVVKKYLPKVLEDIELINQTPKHHTKKVVQLRLRARNFALQLHQKVCKRNAEEVHGEVLS